MKHMMRRFHEITSAYINIAIDRVDIGIEAER